MGNIQPETIKLFQADLTVADDLAVRLQSTKAPFIDPPLLAQWESTWQHLWERSALAFATPNHLIMTLKTVLGWHSGNQVGCDPLLHPAWNESFNHSWLKPLFRDVDPHTGQGYGPFIDPTITHKLKLCAGLVQHTFGKITPLNTHNTPFLMEDISSILKPIPGCGKGDVQLLLLDGNSMLSAGASCLILSKDDSLIQTLRPLRHNPPGPLACALGLSQLKSLNHRLERRQKLAENYGNLYHQNCFQLPTMNDSNRVWEMFLLSMKNHNDWLDLRAFLNKSGIMANTPLWPKTNHTHPTRNPLPGLYHFQQHTLALPLYASLSDTQHKKICNRLHRWIQRHVKKNPLKPTF